MFIYWPAGLSERESSAHWGFVIVQVPEDVVGERCIQRIAHDFRPHRVGR